MMEEIGANCGLESLGKRLVTMASRSLTICRAV